jgi:hypothetical protein
MIYCGLYQDQGTSSLSALYPAETNEKRWGDGVLARKKGLGL